ncbi:MAG TPA: hypothetical protein VFG54_12105 [Prolixibacteraceae bacterium]|nr:hypothetical protein [Prolixibacteraceae bacterium]
MRIFACKYLRHINGITLAPFGIFVKPGKLEDRRLLNHEKIHWRQQWEMGILLFYVWYLVEWMWKGYRGISFEKEAYEKDGDEKYLDTRKAWAWWKWM